MAHAAQKQRGRVEGSIRLHMPINAPLGRKLRMGLVGGGQGAFIGRVHAIAALLDNRAVLCAGALSWTQQRREPPRRTSASRLSEPMAPITR